MIEEFKDMFKPQDVKELAKKDEETKQAIDLTGDLARCCLNQSSFKRYKDQFTIAEERTMQSMLACTQAHLAGHFDITSYAQKMLAYMVRVKDMRILLDTIRIDAKKGKEEAKDEE